jgi:predicted amidohydrolase YtcJ
MIAMASTRVFVNGRIFASVVAQKETTDFADCMVLEGDKISHVGSKHDDLVQEIIQSGVGVIDLENRVITPGFIDAHTHLLFFGLSLRKLDLTNCSSLEQVKSAISSYAREHPEMPRILCRGWHQPSTGRLALAAMLDELDPQQRPIYVEALDLHSTWVNTAALRELPLDHAKDLDNHQVPRDEGGDPTGLFAEGGQTDIVWPYLNEK